MSISQAPTKTARIKIKSGADDRIRTGDPLITNEMLYQLSYVGYRVVRIIEILLFLAMVKILIVLLTKDALFVLSACLLDKISSILRL